MYEELVKTLRLRAALWEKMYDEDTVLKQAADAIEELKQNIEQYKLYLQDAINDLRSAHEKEPKWISVDERLPEDHVRVLLCNDEGKIMTGERAEGDWWYCYFAYDVDRWDVNEQGQVVAWMLLPESPVEDLCDDCRYAPPSCLDGKPCCACDPTDPIMSCYSKKEQNE